MLNQEWEAVRFPITISRLDNNEAFRCFGENTTIKIWRDKEYKLVGRLYGATPKPKLINNDNFIGRGNIIKGDNIKGIDELGNLIEIFDCVIHSISSNSWNRNELGYVCDCDIKMDKIYISSNSQKPSKASKRLDWFLCSKVDAQFSETTIRYEMPKGTKIREGIDEYNKSDIDRNTSVSWSRDYNCIEVEGIKFIIANIPKEIIENNLAGLCFEFRDQLGFEIPSSKKINNIKNLASFLLGNNLVHIGYSLLNGNEVIKSVSYSVYNHIFQLTQKSAMPPIKFNTQYDWGKFQWLLNNLLGDYLQFEQEFKLDEVLSRYWIALSLPLGVNLPILANALEVLAFYYLKKKNELKTETIPTEEYNKLIGTELLSLEAKFSNYKDGNMILNKYKNANQRGSSEKINHFFNLLKIEIGKQEKAAINLRNKMIHSIRDYSEDDKIFDDLILSRIYQVLFNRTLLKLLNYDGYYIDYSMQGCPLKHISKIAGSE